MNNLNKILEYIKYELKDLNHITVEHEFTSYYNTIHVCGYEDIYLEINFEYSNEYYKLSSDYYKDYSSKEFNEFFNHLYKKIEKNKSINFYNEISLETDQGIIYYIKDYPVMNLKAYDNFIDDIIGKKSYLYKYVHLDLISTETRNKYRHLEIANNFDLI